jgi:hypothetical protein
VVINCHPCGRLFNWRRNTSYRWLYPETIIDKINRARGAEQTLALRVDLREAIRPLMAAFNLEPDSECSGCGGRANDCAECVTKWRKMKSLKEFNEDRGERAPKAVEEGKEEEGEQGGKVLRPALSVVDEGSGQEGSHALRLMIHSFHQ